MNRRSFFKRMAGGIAGVAALPLASEADIAKEEDGQFAHWTVSQWTGEWTGEIKNGKIVSGSLTRIDY
jgi:hypothetical protein